MNPFQKLCKPKGWFNKKAVENVHRPYQWRLRLVLTTGSSAQAVSGPSGYRNPPLSFSTPRRKLINPRPRPTLKPFGFPYGKTLPQIIRIESQRFADVGKRKQPIAVCILNPILGLLKKNLALTLARKNVFLEARNGILQHRQHELLFRLQMQLSPESIQKLLRQKRVGLKQRSDSFLHAQSSLVTHKTTFLLSAASLPTAIKTSPKPVTRRLRAKRSR